MKKKILFLILLISFALVVQPAMADTRQSEAWLIDDEGNRTTHKIIETGNNLDLGKIRLRESGFTADKLKTGDKLALILSNASFAQTPLLLDPPATQGNILGRSGSYILKRVPETGRPGDNAVVYEIIRRNIFDPDHRNLDYVFHLRNINAENEGDVNLTIIAGSQDDTVTFEIIKPQTILIAEVYNVIPESVVKDNLIDHQIISRELNNLFNDKSNYFFSSQQINLSFPINFFVLGDMVGFLNDERWTFRLEINNVEGLRVINPELSEIIGAPKKEILTFKKDGFGAFSERLIEKQFQPVEITFNNLKLNSLETSSFIPVKFIPQEDGTFKKEIIGNGSYDHLLSSYTFTITAPGIYSIEQLDTKKITMTIDNNISNINGIQQRLDVSPRLINGVTYVPIRFLAENLGAEVEFLSETNQVEIKTADKTIYLPINQVTAELATPARIIEGRTLVPVRFVSEQLGATVSYFADARRIEIIK